MHFRKNNVSLRKYSPLFDSWCESSAERPWVAGRAAEELEEALRASLQDTGGTAGPPPASKSAVQALQQESVTPERLRELGGADVECCVCRYAWQFCALSIQNSHNLHGLIPDQILDHVAF